MRFMRLLAAVAAAGLVGACEVTVKDDGADANTANQTVPTPVLPPFPPAAIPERDRARQEFRDLRFLVDKSDRKLSLFAGDRLLLCSDGLSDYVEDAAITSALVTYGDRQQCGEQLVKLAHQAGAPDNVTVVVSDVTEA